MRLVNIYFLFLIVSLITSGPASADANSIDSFIEKNSNGGDWNVQEWQTFALSHSDQISKTIEQTERDIEEDEELTKNINSEIQKQEQELENLELNIDEATSEIKKFDVTQDETHSNEVKAFAEAEIQKWESRLDSFREKHEQLREAIQRSQKKKSVVENKLQNRANKLRQYLVLAQLSHLPKIEAVETNRKLASIPTDHEHVLKIVSDIRKSRQETHESIENIKTSMKTGP